jgi:adenylate kinase
MKYTNSFFTGFGGRMAYLPDLVIMGMQGCGKGTVASKLSEKYGFKIFEMSERLTREKETNPEFREKIESLMAQGKLVGPNIILGIVDRFLETVDADQPILWDGVPRTVIQLRKLKFFLDKHNRDLPVGMHIDVSSETALARMAGRGRADDKNVKARENRIKFFLSQTQPAIEKFPDVFDQPVLRVDGEPGPLDVFHEACDLLEGWVKNNK